MKLSHTIAAATIAAFAAPLFAQNYVQEIPTPDPAAELSQFTVADGFEVNLFAGDPMVANPIQINFDEEGRMWVAGSAVYPHIAPGQEASDVITVLEDTDRDGVADKSTIFAEGLFIPTGIMPGDGGAYVCNSTELLHLSDTDGDGKADKTRVMLSGFGTEDTHHIAHTLHFGNDGLYYFNQSIYIHSHIETPYGVRRLGGGGIWQFRPETMELGVLAYGLVNSWGHKRDAYGQSFATDGAGGEGINYMVPGAYYFTAPGAVRIVQGLNPGSPKHCSLEIVSGRHFPDDWQDSMITNDFRGHRVCRFVVDENKAGFKSTEQQELMKTQHVAFRPVDVTMGPDGALYIADWYNPIIQHGEVDFRDPRRDHNHGRIWRVTNKSKPVLEYPKIKGATEEALLDMLKSEENWTRLQAKRVLKERGDEAVLPALETWVGALGANNAENLQHKLEGLWMYQALDVANKGLLEEMLNADDHRVRAAALRVAVAWEDDLSLNAQYFAPFVLDENPRVRLEAIRSLGALGGEGAFPAALKALDKEMDNFLDYGLWLTARDTWQEWYPRLQQGNAGFESETAQVLFALRAIDDLPAVNRNVVVAKFLRQDNLAEEDQVGFAQLLAKFGNPKDVDLLLGMALDEMRPNTLRKSLLQQVAVAAQRGVMPASGADAVLTLLGHADSDMQKAAMSALGAMRLESARAALETLALKPEAEASVQSAAVDAIAGLGGEAGVKFLLELSENGAVASTQNSAVAALTRIDPKTGAAQTAKLLQKMDADGKATSLIAPFLQQENAAPMLAEALQGKSINAELAKKCVRQAGATGRDMGVLIQALQQAGGLNAATPPPTPEELVRLVQLVAEHGDARRGESQFRRLECFKCHAIGGAGSLLGPDLVSIGGSAQVDYLIESLLTPNKAIKEGYHSTVINTDNLETYSGIVIAESDTEIVLRDATNAEHSIQKAEIESREQGQSLMPDGSTGELLENEFADLVKFLSELGRTPDFSIGTDRVARTWRVVAENDIAANRLYAEGLSAFAHADIEWMPMYSTVAGILPVNDMPRLRQPYWNTQYSYAQCQVDVQGAGKVEFELSSADGRRVWVNGKEIHLQDNGIRFDADPGVYTITILSDFYGKREDLRLGIGDGTAQAAFVMGR